MKKQSFKGNLLLLGTVTLVLSIGLATPQAFAAEGDVQSSLVCAGTGVGVAFDGTNLWWVKGLTSTTLGRCDTAGNVLADVPITGLQVGDLISTLSYDASRNLFWAITGNSSPTRSIYQIALDGTATFQYDLNVPGLSLVDGIAYDGEDDSLWISPDVNPSIWHFNAIDGALIAGPIAIPDSATLQAAEAQVGFNCGNSGVAAGTGILYLGFNGCNVIQKHNKADLSLISAFVLNGAARVEDLECDNVTFAGFDVIWSKDAFDTDLIAFEVPQGTCPVGGGGEHVVGGSIIPIDASALLIAGAFTNAIWMAPVIAGAAGTTAFYLKTRKN